MSDECTHADAIRDVTPSALGCEECLKIGSPWVHLRLCRTCGHVGCCDDSPNRHATKHFHNTRHPIIEGYDPPEGWGWCYVDEIVFDLSDRATPHNGLSLATIKSAVHLPRPRLFLGKRLGLAHRAYDEKRGIRSLVQVQDFNGDFVIRFATVSGACAHSALHPVKRPECHPVPPCLPSRARPPWDGARIVSPEHLWA
jgi:hypothetical protein